MRRINLENRGFTLIELLVVIAIIGVLSSVVLSSLNSARMKARDARRIADLGQIRNALELFYDDNGYYPSATAPVVGCPTGYDCGGYYRFSNNPGSWASLAADLLPYIKVLPIDPINTACSPWYVNCFSYSYGNVSRYLYTAQYDLTTQLEDSNNPQRCTVRAYRFSFLNQAWCGIYPGQIYEASN